MTMNYPDCMILKYLSIGICERRKEKIIIKGRGWLKRKLKPS